MTHHSKPHDLPPPNREGGMPLRNALNLRHSTRSYTSKPIPEQLLSDLLWAACGINRANGDRTAPYWRHVMIMDIYVAMENGVFLYDPATHRLLPHLPADIRAQTGLQDFPGNAPLDLIYVAHGERMEVPEAERRLYASVDTGCIGQNVYLFCAAEGLSTVFRGAIEREKLAKTLKLPKEQFVTFAQTIGYAA
ncbi:nitroreductase family protein [Acidocella sp.]|uniref:nitroreductase family protein n=1 Tax=Acidocella sp. TaxID=50710 RepID=UPI001822AF4E|nr:nitroreductase family protein [Acidocella sp.]NNM58081.1 nitroreductase family protein [Acidocella sp.]